MSIPRFIGVTVDLERGVAIRRGVTSSLSSLDLRRLLVLRASGEGLSRARPLETVWGYRAGVESRTLDTTMRRLREKVELDPESPRHLLTLHGFGYRYVGAPSPG